MNPRFSIVPTLLAISFTGAASASVAGMQGLHATNYLLKQDGSATTGAGAYYSVMDVYVKYSSAYGTGTTGERIVSFYGQSTTDSATFGVAKSSRFVNDEGLAFQHSNASWLPGASANGGAGNQSWDSFITIGGRTQGVGNTGNVTADIPFLNPNTPDPMQGGSNASGTYIGPGWYQSAPTEAAFETNASAHADKMIMIGRWSLKITDILSTSGISSPPSVKMTVWGDTTGKSLAQSGGTTLYTVSAVNLKSDAQTRYSTFGKTWIFDSSFTGIEAGQEAWTFATGPAVPTPGVVALMGVAGILAGKRRRLN